MVLGIFTKLMDWLSGGTKEQKPPKPDVINLPYKQFAGTINDIYYNNYLHRLRQAGKEGRELGLKNRPLTEEQSMSEKEKAMVTDFQTDVDDESRVGHGRLQECANQYDEAMDDYKKYMADPEQVCQKEEKRLEHERKEALATAEEKKGAALKETDHEYGQARQKQNRAHHDLSETESQLKERGAFPPKETMLPYYFVIGMLMLFEMPLNVVAMKIFRENDPITWLIATGVSVSIPLMGHYIGKLLKEMYAGNRRRKLPWMALLSLVTLMITVGVGFIRFRYLQETGHTVGLGESLAIMSFNVFFALLGGVISYFNHSGAPHRIV